MDRNRQPGPCDTTEKRAQVVVTSVGRETSLVHHRQRMIGVRAVGEIDDAVATQCEVAQDERPIGKLVLGPNDVDQLR